jgi:hypothetical protein
MHNMAMDFSRYGMAPASKSAFFWAMRLGYNDVARSQCSPPLTTGIEGFELSQSTMTGDASVANRTGMDRRIWTSRGVVGVGLSRKLQMIIIPLETKIHLISKSLQ